MARSTKESAKSNHVPLWDVLAGTLGRGSGISGFLVPIPSESVPLRDRMVGGKAWLLLESFSTNLEALSFTTFHACGNGFLAMNNLFKFRIKNKLTICN